MLFWTGVAFGATAMYFLDSQNGARRRAMARETYERVRPTLNERLGDAEPTIRDLGQRVRGAAERVPVLRVIKGGKQDGTLPAERPSILADLSDTQMQELTRQFREQDRQAWNALAASYGWASAQADEVWHWFEQRPAPHHEAVAA